MFLQAIQHAGCRAIVQHGWTQLAKDRQLPDTVYAIDYLPHNWVFPRISCLVHHGGGGTTAAALRAGIPTVVIPSNPGVFPWAQSANSLGCCGAVIPYREVGAEKLGAAIARTLANPVYGRRAKEIGRLIQEENGVQTACALIQEFMATPSLQRSR